MNIPYYQAKLNQYRTMMNQNSQMTENRTNNVYVLRIAIFLLQYPHKININCGCLVCTAKTWNCLRWENLFRVDFSSILQVSSVSTKRNTQWRIFFCRTLLRRLKHFTGGNDTRTTLISKCN